MCSPENFPSILYINKGLNMVPGLCRLNMITHIFKVNLYDSVIFDHFSPSDWRGNRDEF